MSYIKTTVLGRSSSVANGQVIAAPTAGAHNLVCKVTGTGNVSFTAALMGSHDNVTYAQIAQVTASGADVAASVVGVSSDYMFWRLDVSAISGAGAVLEGYMVNVGAISAGGPSSSVSAAIASQSTAVAANKLILKASPGNFYGAQAVTGGTAGYLMLFDAVDAPADGAVTPKKVWNVAANGTIEVGYQAPIRMAVGATLVFSSTGPFTKTASATAFLSGECV